MGADFFPEGGGGENASKIVMPLKMAIGEGILFALLVEGYRGVMGGDKNKPNFCTRTQGLLPKRKEKQGFYSKKGPSLHLEKPHKQWRKYFLNNKFSLFPGQNLLEGP